MFDYLVVGAGFAGAVMAERLADAGARKVSLSTSGCISAATPTIATTVPAS